MPDLASLPIITTATTKNNDTTSAIANDNSPQAPPPHLSPSPPPPSTHLNISSSSTTPGPRAAALTSIFTTALSHVLHTISYPNFSSCFPTPASSPTGSLILESVWRQVMVGLEEKCKREYEEILVERDVVGGLGELERVVADARVRMDLDKNGKGDGGKGMGRGGYHTLPPQDLFLAHLHPFLTDASLSLTEEMVLLAKENEDLVRGIESQREEVGGLVRGLEAVMGDLEGANAVLTTAAQAQAAGGESGGGGVKGEGKGSLKSEAVDMDMEMEMEGMDMARSRL